MMGVPPPRNTSGTSPSRGGEGHPSHKKGRREGKEFTLPKKQEEEKKQKEITEGEHAAKELEQSISEKNVAATRDASAIHAAEAKTSVQAVSRLIQNLVTDMRIGQIDGKTMASMNLSSTASEIPKAFAGSNLTLNYQENGLAIHFDHFMTPQQQNNAITLVEKNKEQLLEMVQALQAKNISINQLTIGNHVVTLPRVESLPPPFQPTTSSELHDRREREQQMEREREEPGSE